MSLLSRGQIEERLRALDGWRLERDAIVKQFTFAGFPEAVAFVTRLVPGAEAADHHKAVGIDRQMAGGVREISRDHNRLVKSLRRRSSRKRQAEFSECFCESGFG